MDSDHPTDPLAQLDIMGAHEVALLLGITPLALTRLRGTDPAFPTATRLKIGPVWSGLDIRAYDMSRRRMGIYPAPANA